MKPFAAITVVLALLVPPRASAQTFLEPPRYIVTVWDGEPTAGGLWFTIDGRAPTTETRLTVVDRLPQGVTVDATRADLRLSAALAAHLSLRPGVPTLFEIGRVAPPPQTQRDIALAADNAANEYAERHARVTALLAELRSAAANTVAAGYRAAPPDPEALP
jgi:hypothetical protein